MRRVLIFGLILIILSGGTLFFWSSIQEFFQIKLPEIETVPQKITQFTEKEKEISLPTPLRTEKEYPEAFLTKDGIIEWTNIQREKYGLPPLKENPKLNATAQAKVEDMFKNQYFDHYSPLTGEGVADLAEKFTYEFLTIGENLALGNFQDDKTLVDGWMASPGHRANILNSSYQEIGVAVRKGIFEGKTTWLAVQHFGLSLSACPQPDLALKKEIEENQEKLSKLEKELLALKDEIRPMRPRIIPKVGEDDFQKIEKYNELVSQYNTIVEEQKLLINQYNSQINTFNQCLERLVR